MAFLLTACSTFTKTVYVPVEEIKTEYKVLEKTDSIYVHDSLVTIIEHKGDTVFIDREKLKYIYKYENRTDTVLIVDSIPIIQPVEKIVEVNKIYTWQKILMLLGIGAIIIVVLNILK